MYPENLESQRLITRKLTQNDIPAWAHFFAVPEAIEFMPLFASKSIEESSTLWIERQLERYKNNQFGLHALVDKQSQTFIGQCGLLQQEVDGIAEVEVGYHVFKQYWGKGYAPEAAKIFIDYAFKNELTNTVISIIHVDNLKSQRVAEKNGLKREKETVWKELPICIYRIHKTDWEK